MAQGRQDGGLRAPETAEPQAPPAGAVRLHGCDLATCVAGFSASAAPAIRLTILGEVSVSGAQKPRSVVIWPGLLGDLCLFCTTDRSDSDFFNSLTPSRHFGE